MAECTWCSREIESPGLCDRCTLNGYTREQWNARLDRLRWLCGAALLAIAIGPLVVLFVWGEAAAIACLGGIALLGLQGGVGPLFAPFFARKV